MKKAYIFAILVLVFRILDLYTTQLAIINFHEQEQNLLVKFFHLDMNTFFIIELFLALLLATCYLYYVKYKQTFIFSKSTFLEYFHFFIFKKNNVKISDWLFKMSVKRVLILFGSTIPVFIITTSIIFCLNNYWVYLFVSENKIAVKYYLIFNEFYFFDIVIFVFPPLFLIFLLYKKLHTSYIYNKQFNNLSDFSQK